MSDKTTLNQKVWWQLVGHISCTAPVVIATALTAMGTVSQDGVGWFVGGFFSLLVGVGAAAVRAVYKYEDIAKNIEQNTEKARNQEQEDKLDQLRNRLAQDNDPRDEHLLDDLRNYLSGFHPERKWMKTLDRGTFAQVVVHVQSIFDECIAILENSVELRDMMNSISRDAAKSLKKDRDDKIEQVTIQVRKLEEILIEVQRFSGKQLSGKISAGTNGTETADSLLHALKIAGQTEDELAPTSYARKYDQFGGKIKAAEEADDASVSQTTGRKTTRSDRV